MLRSFLLLISLAVASPAAAWTERVSPDIPLSGAGGGDAAVFYDRITYAREHGITYALEKACQSSCTLLTALLQDGLLCARPGTQLIFHEFVWVKKFEATGSIIDINTMEIDRSPRGRTRSREATARAWRTYPAQVRNAIAARSPNGYLPPWGDEVTIPAATLGIPTC